jgi:peptidylprolyl isomerase
VTNFNAFSTLRSRAILGLAALAVVILIAGCGSSSGESTIGVGEESKSAEALAKATATSSASTGASGSTGTATPTSGPLSKEPTVVPPTGATPSKLVIKELIVGTGAEAKAGDSVTVNYVGVLFHGGKEFDASWKRNEPFVFSLGRGQVIKGWDKGVAGMKVGGRRELIIPAAEAYGAAGSPPTIPANAPLVFVIDLLAV